MAASNPYHSPDSIARNDNSPAGCVLLIEPQRAHLKFLEAVPEVSTILLRLTDVETLVNQSHTAESYFPKSVEVITTSTVNDRYLSELHWHDEFEIVREFSPDYHIPCDLPVYRTTHRSIRRERITNYFDRVLAFAQAADNVSFEVIPLAKALTREEWIMTKTAFDLLDVEFYALYGTQYFLEEGGFSQLLTDVRVATSVNPCRKILLIGLLSPRLLRRLPSQVTAAAGLNQWRTRVCLREAPPDTYQHKFVELQKEVNSALGQGQAPLGMWLSEAEGVA